MTAAEASCGATLLSHRSWRTGETGLLECADCGDVVMPDADAYARRVLGLPVRQKSAMRGWGRGVRTSTQRRAFLDEWIAEHGPECFYCGRELQDGVEPPAVTAMTLDHLIPRSYGGRSNEANLVLACPPCNKEKADAMRLLVRTVVALRRANRSYAARLGQIDDTIADLKDAMIALGGNVVPSEPRRTEGVHGRCRRCREGLLPGVRHWCRSLGGTYSPTDDVELGVRVVEGLAGENGRDAHDRVKIVKRRGYAALGRRIGGRPSTVPDL